MDIWQAIDRYNDLRIWAIAHAKRHPELFAEGDWFRSAISESDATLDYTTDGNLTLHGRAFTSQTMEHEYFDITIPRDQIPTDLLEV